MVDKGSQEKMQYSG